MKGDALLIVDMINEFVSGRFGSPRACRVVARVVKLREKARAGNVPIFYVRDAHMPADPELRVWGRHAMKGTQASEIVEALLPLQDEKVFDKRQYSGFHNTGLDAELRGEDVRRIFLAGISADICVQHNAADAFYRGYRISVVSDCVESISPAKKAAALRYMHDIYGCEIVRSEQVKF